MTRVLPALLFAVLGLGACAGTKEVAQPFTVAEPAPAPESSPAPAAAPAPVVDVARPAADAPAPAPRDATLRVRLRGDDESAAFPVTCELWRLAVPEDELQTSGDQIWRSMYFAEAADDAEVAGLPPGRYRLHCVELRDGAEDPPEFVLTEGANERDVVVAAPREFRLRLLLVDDAGRAIRGDVFRTTGLRSTQSSTDNDIPPRWAHPRQVKPVLVERVAHSTVFAVGCGFGGATTVVCSDDDGFFDLGRRREPGRRGYETWNDTYLPRGWTGADVHADDRIGIDTTFVGVSTRIDVLVAGVTCPDGSRLDPAAATISTKCDAVRLPWTPPPDAWRTVPVHVRITKPGCEPLEFDWTAATADAPHALVATPAADGK